MVDVPGIDELKETVEPGPPLTRLAAANELAEKLRARGDELLDHFVHAARAEGSSWSEIGSALGATKQAAHQRFGALGDSPAGEVPFGLTGPAGRVFTESAAQARALGHHHVRPEHLVLGLLALPEELAGQALAALGVTRAGARAQLEERLGVGRPRPSGSLGVTPQTKRLLALGRSIANALGFKCPRTEHILLAATSKKLDSPAAALLAECGAPPERVTGQVMSMILQETPELEGRLRSRSLLSRVRMRAL